MGFGGISIWQLLIVLAIVVLLFGTKKLRNIGGDLGSAIKNFKQSMKEGETEEGKDEGVPVERQLGEKEGRVFDSEVEHKDKKEA